MITRLLLVYLVFILHGCGEWAPNGGGGALPPAFWPSHVVEDASGKMYIILNTGSATKSLYTWNKNTQTWEMKVSFTSHVMWNETFMGQAGNIWLNNSSGSGELLPVISINPKTMQAQQYPFKVNQFLVGGDMAVEYQGLLVNSYQPTTGTSVYLHSLPTPSVAAQGMGITLNTQPYQMLCIPVLKYFQWDGQTHYCMLANDVKYFTNLPPLSSAVNNDVIEFIVSITNVGNTYQLLDHFQTPLAAILQSYPAQESFSADYPMFSSLVKSECVGSVDKQGNYHQFCNDTGDSTKFTYRFYDKVAPTTPLYTQVLP